MKFTKDDLIALIKEQMSAVTSDPDNEFAGFMKQTLENMVKELRENVVRPVPTETVKNIVSNMPFVKIDGNYLTTKQGSIINLKNSGNPWVAISDDLGAWAVEFAKYVKSRGAAVGKLLSGSVDDAGGYLVPDEFKAVLLMYDAEPTLVWQRATVWPMSGQKLSFPKLAQNADVNDAAFDHFAGVSFSWVEEGGEKGETEPDFAMIEMIVHELAGYTEVTNSLLDDSAINLMNYLTRIFRAAWYWTTDRAFIQGTGGKQPLGILNDPSVIHVFRDTASTVKVDDVLNVEAALPAVFDSRAVWFYTKKVRAAIRGQKVSESSDELVLQESYQDLSQGYTATILGRPAILADGKIPAIGSTGDLILGDWSQYYIGFRQDFSMDSSGHYKFRNNRTALRCSGRIDGTASFGQAFVVLDDSLS